MESLEHTGDESMEDVFLQDDLGPSIAEHATQCRSLFHKYLDLPEILEDPTIMDDQLARFTLWTSNMDVWGPLNVSLDYRLRFSPTAADIIHQLLDIICDTLLSLKPIDDRPPHITSRKRQRISVQGSSEVTRRSDYDTGDSESDVDPAEENILKVTETISGTVTRLFRLSNAVRRSAKANRARKIESYNDNDANKAIDELRLYTKCYIEFRFPEAPEPLRSALIEANAWRLRRLHYQRSHRRRIDMSIQSPSATPPTTQSDVQSPKMTGSTPAVRFAPSPLSKPERNNAPVRSPAPVTNATTARQTAVAALYAKPTTGVPCAKSVLVNNKLSFPPIPPNGQCTYCGVIIEFKNSASSQLWQNHIIKDLEPFICIFSQCQGGGHHGGTGPLTFETSKAWSNHMQTAHGHVWECRAPSHDPIVFEQEIHYQEHSVTEHGVPEAHIGMLSRAARRPVLDKVLNCPLGDDFQPPDKVESSAVFSSEALEAHIAGHLKEIALLALQKLPSGDDENAENVDSDQPLEDDGPAGDARVTRQSMCSFLEDEDLGFQDDGTSDADDNPERHEEEMSGRVTELVLEDKDELVMTKLHHAVRADDPDLVGSVIESGASLDCRDEHGLTPLDYAAQRGLVKCVTVLVEHGADLQITDNSGFSPFLWAVVAGQYDATAKLLSMGADANSSSEDGHSALAWAASLGRVSIAQMLLDQGASMHDTANMQQTIPLEKAAASGSLPIVELLIRRGADPNYRDRDGWSAIHWAAEEGHQEIVSFLLDHGANPNAVSSYGTSPLHCAANGGHLSIVDSLLKRGEVDPLKSTCYGWTALHHAAFKGHYRIVDLLLQDDRLRSTASLLDNDGWSVLHLAVHSRDLATVRILLDKSTIEDPQALIDESGLTAEKWLDRGPTSHSQKATSNLAFSKSRCCQAVTELRDAVVIGNTHLIRFLSDSGHCINGMNSGKRTALYYAAKRGIYSIVDLLLGCGADPNILPTGRKSWEEFISYRDVIQRLNLAGYRRRDTNLEVERQIRQALRERGQPPEQPIPHSPGADKSLLFEPSSTNNSTINGNHASGTATQNNIIQVICNIINNPSLDAGLTLARIIELFLNESAPSQISRIFGPEVGRYLVGEYNDRSTSTPEYAHRHHGAKQSYCFVKNAVFSETDAFDRNLAGYLASYPSTKTTRCIVQILSNTQSQTLTSWLRSRDVNKLLLDLSPGGKDRSDWTTHFTLEVIGHINWINCSNFIKSGAAAAASVVAHFCSANVSPAQQWQEAAVRDLLAQLRRAQSDKLVDHHNCKASREHDIVFHTKPQNIRDLWNLLLHAVAQSSIKVLYVIFDNFDSLHSRVDDESLKKFLSNIEVFINESCQDGVLVKVLFTSQSPRMVDYFPAFQRISLSQDPRERFKF